MYICNPVTDTIKMYAVRIIGHNVHYTRLTYFVDEAETWLNSSTKNNEIVEVHIKPYKP